MKSVIATTLALSLFACCDAYADVIASNEFPVGSVVTTQSPGADVVIGIFNETATASNPAAPGSFNPINFSSVTGGGIGGPVSFISPTGGPFLMTVNDVTSAWAAGAGRSSTDANASRQGRIELFGSDSFMFASPCKKNTAASSSVILCVVNVKQHIGMFHNDCASTMRSMEQS